MAGLEERDFQNQKIKPETWKLMLSFAMRRKNSFILVSVSGFLCGLIDMIMTFMSMWAIDSFMTPGTMHRMPLFAAATVLLQVLMVVFVLLMCRRAGFLAANLCSDVRRDCFAKLQTLSFSYFDNSAVGYLLSRLTNDITRVFELLSFIGIELSWSIMAVVAGLISMFIVNFKLAVITSISVPLLAVVSVYFQKIILKYQRESRKINSMITSSFNEGIMGAQTSKTLVREELNNRDFTNLTGRMRGASLKAALVSAVYMPIASMIISVVVGFVMVRGGNDVLGGLLTVGQLNFFINIGHMMFEPIRNFAGIFAEFQSSQAAAERVADVMTAVADISDTDAVIEKFGDSFTQNTENWPPINGEIEFKNVSFWYKENETVLKDFNLSVKPGEHIALVGETGGGKSTIVNLICRFYEPKQGEILIDGVNYKERSQLWLQSSLGYVLQQPHLFSGTIRENIRYGRLDATDAEIESAAKLVGAHDFITELEKGYDSEAGEGGGLMSTGQKQLISFARAIIADPRIFILDEATSSIDTESEMKIQKAADTLLSGRTSFIIAHRLSTVRNADRILVIEDGAVLEEGSHNQLIAKKGHYYDLYMNQFRKEQLEKSLTFLKRKVSKSTS